ncbi:MAG: GAF domain-containing protein, partial [Nitrospirales bacterium]
AGTIYDLEEPSGHMRQLVVHGRLTRLAEDVWTETLARLQKQGRPAVVQDLLLAPMKRNGVLDGVIVLQGIPKNKAQSEKLGALLESAATGLSTAFQHARLAQKYAEKIVRIQQLEEVSEILNSSLGEHEILARSLEGAVKLVDAQAGSLLLLDEEKRELHFQVAVGRRGTQLREMRLPLGHGIAGLVAKSGKPMIVNDAQEDPRVAREVDELIGFTTRSLLAVPIRIRNRTLGVLEAVNKRSGKPFSRWDLIEFSSLSHQVAIALENSRLLGDHQSKITRLQRLQGISGVLNSTLKQAEVRKRAIQAVADLLEAEAGSLLLLDESAQELYFEVALGEKGEEVRQVRLKLDQGIAGYVARTGEPVLVNDVQHDPRFLQSVDKQSGFVTRNMVCVPVKARDKLLGVLQAINKKQDRLFTDDDLQDFVSLGHQVGIAIENANLYEEISGLFEGFISASVMAIESRDPTTKGHSERVATLTCGLAEVVDRIAQGPYAGVRFSPDQVREMRYAALLHDFGKVGVREHVLLKAKKLYPGDLALVKARFDFIKRTLEVQALKKKVELLLSGDRGAAVSVLKDIDEDLAQKITDTEGLLWYLLQCSEPTIEPVEGFERLREVADLTYDSYEGVKPYLTEEEVLALSVTRGSLTSQEREEIQSHVTHTYRFLATIPWTKALKHIPQIAYGHHEKLDGTGYPLKIPSEGISVQTRMMTISDIYDALTAADRPYKVAASTSRALDILHSEVKEGKLDPHLFDLFVEAKVYTRTRTRP